MLRERYGIVSIDSKIRKGANIDHNLRIIAQVKFATQYLIEQLSTYNKVRSLGVLQHCLDKWRWKTLAIHCLKRELFVVLNNVCK